MTTIFNQEGPMFYPFTPPQKGSIDDLCSNPTKYKQLSGANKGATCTFLSKDLYYANSGCGTNFKPVLDCGGFTNDNVVCCPEKIFPYAMTTNYCSYLDKQGCWSHTDIACPSYTVDIPDCGMCCPNDISNNMNFSSTDYNPSTMTKVGDLWNKNFANFEDGVYKIGFNNGCLISPNKNSTQLKLYETVIPGPGDCGATWQLTKMTEWYTGSGDYPGKDLKYAPGGYTLFNKISGKYLSMAQNPYVSGINVSLTDTPTVVAIYKNTDGTYRIMNAKNQVSSFFNLGNIGNPEDCLVVNENKTVGAYNWGVGNQYECGNNSEIVNNYKFVIEKVSDSQKNIPVQISDGEYVIEVVEKQPFTGGDPTNKCLQDNISMSNDGGITGVCGTMIPRYKLDQKFRWKITNKTGGGFTLQSKTSGLYLQSPTYDGSGKGIPITTSSNQAVVYLYKNLDNTVRITDGFSPDSQICVINDSGTLKGFNWNINNLECGTGPNATITNYKFNLTPVQPIVIPPVSDIQEGIYELSTFTNETNTVSQIYDDQEGINYSKIINMLDFHGSNLNEKRWIIAKAVDSDGNKGYTIKNISTKRYLTLNSSDLVGSNHYLDNSQYGWANKEGGAPPRFITTPDKSVLYIYQNQDNSTYTIQSIDGFCLQSVWAVVDHWCGFRCTDQWGSGFNKQRGLESLNACGLTNLPDQAKISLTLIPPPPPMPTLTGNGGNCYYTWYTVDSPATYVSAFSDAVSCNNAINIAKASAATAGIDPSTVDGSWTPFFNGDVKTIYNYGGICLAVDSNHTVIPSATCKAPQDCSTGQCIPTPGNYAFNWIFTPDTDISGVPTGKYTVQNQLTQEYLTIPSTSSTSNLTTTPTKTPINISLTYPTFGSQYSQAPQGSDRLQPASYYFHFTNPNSSSEICSYSDNVNIQSISWSNKVGPVSGSPIAPVSQQQRQQMYECGIDPNSIGSTEPDRNIPNPNYQFTVNKYCLGDFSLYYNEPICFKDDGSKTLY